MNSLILVGLDGSGVGTCCPTQGWLAEMNSLSLVGLDVFDGGTRCPGEENKVTWFEEEITAAIAGTGTLWLGLLGMMAIMWESFAFMAIS